LLWAACCGAAHGLAQEQDATPETQEQNPSGSSQTQASGLESNANNPQKNAPTAQTTVRGVVRNAVTGAGLERALVHIEGEAETGVLTDGEGRFELKDVPVGPQTVRVRKPGFHDRLYASEEMGYETDGPAHNVLVAAGMAELEFRLTPAPAIFGRVELTTGDAGDGIEVALLKQTVHNGRAVWEEAERTRTNGSGRYRFAGLAEGVFVVATLPALESEPAVTAVATGRGSDVKRWGYRAMYYPSVRKFGGAAKLKLNAGDKVEANLILELEPFYTVTAAVTLSGGKPFEGGKGFFDSPPHARLLDANGRTLPYPVAWDAASKTFQASLPNGSYLLAAGTTATDPDRSHNGKINSGTTRGQTMLQGLTEFAVEGHGVAGLRVPLSTQTGWPIQVRLSSSASGTLPNRLSGGRSLRDLVSVTAVPAGDPGLASSDTLETVNAVPNRPDGLLLAVEWPAPMWLTVEVNDRSVCVESFTAGSVNLAREPMSVPEVGLAPPMDLTLTDRCGKLTMALPAALAAFLPGDEPFYTVYVTPEFSTPVSIAPLTVHASNGQTVSLDGLTPGRYRVYTLRQPVRLEWRDTEAMAALGLRGQEVTVDSAGAAQLVLEVGER
jgi:hypothetical protein